jgi:hypothetical protein
LSSERQFVGNSKANQHSKNENVSVTGDGKEGAPKIQDPSSDENFAGIFRGRNPAFIIRKGAGMGLNGGLR